MECLTVFGDSPMSSILKVDTIQNTGGTTGLTIDSSGRLGVSNPIIFYARKD